MTYNAVALPLEQAINTTLFVPEGWAFFTRNPREPRFLVFGRALDGTWVRTVSPTDDPLATFAFSRKARSLNVEAGLFSSHVKETYWQSCALLPSSCLSSWSGGLLSIVNPTPRPALCGALALVQQDRVPWAWANRVDPNSMPSRIVRIDVKCDSV